jgi:glycosyltransferase involved in cell wall biosynthesis
LGTVSAVPLSLFGWLASLKAFCCFTGGVYAHHVLISVVIIAYNEQANLLRTLESVKSLVSDGRGEIIVVDSGSTDRTAEIARSFGAKVFVETWKGYGEQKNSAIGKASGEWILSLDADEELDQGASQAIQRVIAPDADLYSGIAGVWFNRKNYFLGKWIRHGGFYPDRKLRLFRRGKGRFQNRAVHETIIVEGRTLAADHASGLGQAMGIRHHSYPTLSDYIEHMNRYSSLGAEIRFREGKRGFDLVSIVVRPLATFAYNYFVRLGFLDGKEGLLLHLYHAAYVSWKYAKAWEMQGGKQISQL